MRKIYTSFLFLSLTLPLGNFNSCSSYSDTTNGLTADQDWDYLLFTQRWPITACAAWEEEKQGNTCNLPKDKTTWTIHGIWPTKTGTDGPSCCNSAIHFDPDAITPIIDDLNEYWTNVEENTSPNSFWKHEWKKHGTCASILPEFDSVLNYFQQGLDWNKEYNLSYILTQGKVVPDSEGYTVEQIYNAIKLYTKKEPMIECVVDAKSKLTMISEIRICFNKSLEVIDCDSSDYRKNKLGAITNCSLKKPIMYFAEVPTNGISYQMDYVDDVSKQYLEDQMYYINIYRFLKFLIWWTT